ncbi:MAG: hypothetical protein HGA37_01480 [Lentimicrobium sp.]|nr:hypothetical protein [Lentimicrobium sp.]
MIKSLLISVSFFWALGVYAQDDNHRVIDDKSGKEILIGTVTRDGLISMGDWFNEEYNKYQPDSAVISNIKTYNDNFPWVFIVLGTWCGDSREQVPHFLKIMDVLDYPAEQIFMVAVDRDKKAGNFCVGDYNVTLVPTFMMTQDSDEIGRIIETPVTTLEQDFLNILNGRIAAPVEK